MNMGKVWAGDEGHQLNIIEIVKDIEALKKKVTRMETEIHILKSSSRTYYETEEGLL